MVGAEQEKRPHPDLYPVAEGRPGTGGDVAEGLQGTERPVPGEGAEGDDDHHAPEGPDLPGQVGQAAVPLLGERLVVRRSAPDDGRDVAVGEGQAVALVASRRLAGEAGPVQRPVEPVARRVAGEQPPGAVPAVGGGGEAHDEQASAGVAEAGEGAGPVGRPPEARGRRRGHRLPPGNEPGAPPAADHLRIDLFEGFQPARSPGGVEDFSTSAVENPPRHSGLAQLFLPMWTTEAAKARSLKARSRRRCVRRGA